MQITEEDIEKAARERGLKLLGVEGRGSRSRIRVACANCGLEKEIRYTSLWHQSRNCRNCFEVPLDLDTFRAYVNNGSWKFLGPEPRRALEVIDLECTVCGRKRRLRYRSFMNKPYCKHRSSYVQMLIESGFNSMGYQVHRMPKTRRTQVQVTCRVCQTPRTLSLRAAEKVGGCPECRIRKDLLWKLPHVKRICSRSGNLLELQCFRNHRYVLHRDKAHWRRECPECKRIRRSQQVSSSTPPEQ